MRISDWSSDVCSSELLASSRLRARRQPVLPAVPQRGGQDAIHRRCRLDRRRGGGERAAASHHALWRGRSRSEEHTSELQSLMRISYAVFCLKKKIKTLQKVYTPNK